MDGKGHGGDSPKFIIPKMIADNFDWSRWRKGLVIWREIGIACRKTNIVENKYILRHHAIGYLLGENLLCRSKEQEYAVMFLIDNDFCWTHFRKDEFIDVFAIK